MNYNNQILWNNSAIKINNSTVFRQSWYDKGVKTFNDIVTDEGKIMTYDALETKYQLHSNFIEYFSLTYAIPSNWKKNIKPMDMDDVSSQDELLSKIKMTKKVCKLVHDNCIQKLFKVPNAEIKWALFFDDLDLDWPQIYTISFQSSLSTRLRYFQYKLLHRYLGVNKLVHQMGIIDSNLCTFCNDMVENIEHLFWYCNITYKFWQDVHRKILAKHVNCLTMRNVLLGCFDASTFKFNFIILQAKYDIFTAKCKKVNPNITAFINILKDCRDTEKHIAVRNNNITKWNIKWDCITL